MDIGAGHRRPALAELLDHGSRRVDVLPLPAILLRDRQADQAHLRNLAEEIPVPGRLPVPFPSLFARHLVGYPAAKLAADFGHVAWFGGKAGHAALLAYSPISSRLYGVDW